MVTVRVISIVVVIIILELFLLVAAYDHRHHHAAVGSRDGFPVADRGRTSAGVAGDHKDMEKLISWRRKMAKIPPHKSPPGPHNFRHQRRVLGASLEREDDRPPSPAAKNSGLGGAGGDVMTTMKQEIMCSGGGKHNNHDEYGVVASTCRRWRKLIAAGPSDSPPSPGYHRP